MDWALIYVDSEYLWVGDADSRMPWRANKSVSIKQQQERPLES